MKRLRIKLKNQSKKPLKGKRRHKMFPRDKVELHQKQQSTLKKPTETKIPNIGTIWGKLIQRNLLSFKDPLGFSKTVFIKTTYFEDDLVNYFFENQIKQTCQTVKHFNKEDPLKIFGNNKTTFTSGKILHKNNYEDFALEILKEKTISLCGQQVKTTGVPGVFYSEECSELKNGNLKITMEMFLSSVVDTLKFEILNEREIFMKIRTLQ